MNIKLAGGIILDSEKRMLLIHRQTKKYDHWEVPGGKIEPGETPEAAARRELLEELGVECEIVRYLGAAGFEDAGNNFSYAWFLVEPSGEPKIMETETFRAARYFSVDELSVDVSLSEGAKCFLELLKADIIKL